LVLYINKGWIKYVDGDEGSELRVIWTTWDDLVECMKKGYVGYDLRIIILAMIG
jgi:hypothetical protein